MRKALFASFVAALVLLSAGVALSGEITTINPGVSARKDIDLQPMFKGYDLKAGGRAMIADGSFQVFGVNVNVPVEDGTGYLVVVSTGEQKHIMGTVTMFLGVGTLRLSWDAAAPGSLPPVKLFKHVWIQDAEGETILQGVFETATATKPLFDKVAGKQIK